MPYGTVLANNTAVLSMRVRIVCLPVSGDPWCMLLEYTIILQRLFFILECGIARFLCAMRVFEVRASSSSPRLLCAKFRFFRGLHWWAYPWRKIAYAYSITHSSSLFDAPGTKAGASENPVESSIATWQQYTLCNCIKRLWHMLDCSCHPCSHFARLSQYIAKGGDKGGDSLSSKHHASNPKLSSCWHLCAKFITYFQSLLCSSLSLRLVVLKPFCFWSPFGLSRSTVARPLHGNRELWPEWRINVRTPAKRHVHCHN